MSAIRASSLDIWGMRHNVYDGREAADGDGGPEEGERGVRKKGVRQVVVRFYPQDEELYERVRSRPRMSEHLRELARRDMEATGR